MNMSVAAVERGSCEVVQSYVGITCPRSRRQRSSLDRAITHTHPSYCRQMGWTFGHRHCQRQGQVTRHLPLPQKPSKTQPNLSSPHTVLWLKTQGEFAC